MTDRPYVAHRDHHLAVFPDVDPQVAANFEALIAWAEQRAAKDEVS